MKQRTNGSHVYSGHATANAFHFVMTFYFFLYHFWVAYSYRYFPEISVICWTRYPDSMTIRLPKGKELLIGNIKNQNGNAAFVLRGRVTSFKSHGVNILCNCFIGKRQALRVPPELFHREGAYTNTWSRNVSATTWVAILAGWLYSVL